MTKIPINQLLDPKNSGLKPETNPQSIFDRIEKKHFSQSPVDLTSLFSSNANEGQMGAPKVDKGKNLISQIQGMPELNQNQAYGGKMGPQPGMNYPAGPNLIGHINSLVSEPPAGYQK